MAMTERTLYSLTLQKATTIQCAIYGNFSKAKEQEFLVSRGKILELMRPDELGRMQTVLQEEVFGVIRSLQPFRLPGASVDHIVVGSDSGRIVVLKYNGETNQFDKVHQETFGKSGCRRIEPGQYLAVDPRGRALMLGAIEKKKLVYVINRDKSARLTILSPLEAHKGRTIVFDCVGVDVGFDNPIFACLELDYTDADADPTGEAAQETPKMLTFYELDFGINHVSRKWSEEVDRAANKLVTVPGDAEGPGGVLICAENWILYKNMDHETIRTPIPRRSDMPDERGLLIVSAATYKSKDFFFFLLQSEFGDLYKVTLDVQEGTQTVQDMHVKYFDTIPVANSLCLSKRGFLFAASEFGDHGFYQFLSLGDEDETAEATAYREEDGDEVTCPLLKPRALTNLRLLDEMQSLSPLMQLRAADLAGEESQQLYALCGRGTRSTLRVLRHGLAVSEVAANDMPGNPMAVWTIPASPEVPAHKYIVVSFVNATLVLEVGETVEETSESGFLATSPTVAVALLSDGAILQVHKSGLRHIKINQGEKRIVRWKPPSKKEIVAATANARQVLIALKGGELVYFELDAANMLSEVRKLAMPSEVVAVDLPPALPGKQRSEFAAVAGEDNIVRLLSLKPDNALNTLSTMALLDDAQSLCLAHIRLSATTMPTLYLHVGLKTGVLQRVEVDPADGTMTGQRRRFLGSRPVKLFRVQVDESMAVLALSSRTWLSYTYQGTFHTSPLSCDTLEYAANFVSEDVPEGIVAISANTLKILAVEQLGQAFNQQVVPLRYTPRKFVVHPTTGYLIMIETDHNSFNRAERAAIKKADAGDDDGDEDMDMDMDESKDESKQPASGAGAGAGAGAAAAEGEEEGEGEVTEAQIGAPMPPLPGKWASCIRIMDPKTGEIYDDVELAENEAAFSVATVVFHDRGGEVMLVVGTAQDMQLHPRTVKHGYIHVYRLLEGKRLQLLHKTQVEDVPYALIEFKGRLAASVGRLLRIYDIGRRKLLKKCESKAMPTFVGSIQVHASRLYVSDMAESVHFFRYSAKENALLHVADDLVPRYTTCVLPLDYDTVAVADKFGNIAVVTLPPDVSDDVDNPTGDRLLWETGVLNGAPNKLVQQCQFHVGEIVTSMQLTTMQGGKQFIVYGTIMGSIGALLPFSARDDVDFFSQLETSLRAKAPPLCGRHHIAYRSSFIPVKAVIDGDYCERFSQLVPEKQNAIAEELDRKPADVLKKLEDTRNSIV